MTVFISNKDKSDGMTETRKSSSPKTRLFSTTTSDSRMSFHEMQASSMAGTLLMPKFVLMNAMRKFGISKPMPVYGSQSFLPQDKLKLQKIADTLAVAHTALLIQLKKAKLLDLRPISEYVELLRNPNPEVCQ